MNKFKKGKSFNGKSLSSNIIGKPLYNELRKRDKGNKSKTMEVVNVDVENGVITIAETKPFKRRLK